MIRRLVSLSTVLLGACSLLQPASVQASTSKRAAPAAPNASFGAAALQSLADELATEQDLDPAWTLSQLRQARHLPKVRQWVLPPAAGTAKNWNAYRDRFIEPRRLQAAQRFWQQHEATLQRAQAQYGVPASLIVGVLGVETFYGRHMGRHRVLDALTTLALDFPRTHPRAAARQAFFRQELGALLRLDQQGQLDVQQVRGSYAGAMGWPQFMPSSWAKYAVDFDGDGRTDLIGNPVDAIGSVAHYFQAFGWKTGLPTHWSVRVEARGDALHTLLQPDIVPSFTAAEMVDLGAHPQAAAHTHEGKLALVLLENGGKPPHYVAGSHNFYVVTRYNWSSYYALAVIELGERAMAIMPKATQADGTTAQR